MVCMPIICTVGITVFPVVHMRFCFRTPCYIAYAVAMLPNLRTAANSTSPMCMGAFHRTAWHAAIMVCMPIICTVGITVFPIVHMRSRFRTPCYIAYAVAVLPNLCAAIHSTKTVLVSFRLCAARYPAGKRRFICLDRSLNLCPRQLHILCLYCARSFYLCRTLGLHGTFIHFIK